MSPYPLAPEFAGVDRPQAVQGPAQYLFTGEDALQIDVLTSAAPLTVRVSGAMLGEGLQLIPFSADLVANNANNVVTFRFSVDSGWLEHVRVTAPGSTVLFGQAFVWIRISRGFTVNALPIGVIASGYITPNTDLYWPGGTTGNPLDGAGAAVRQAVTTPVAGADWSIAVPAQQRWELVSASGLFTASAAVANRQPRLIVDDGANIVFEAPSVVAITAGLAIRESWGAGAGGPVTADILTGGAVSSGLPNDFYLPAGFRVRSSTGVIDVADAWTAISLYVRQWMEGS